MKRKNILLAITLLFLLSILIAGCSDTAAPVSDSEQEQSVESSAEEETAPEAEEAPVDSPTCQVIEFPDSFTLKEPQDIVIGYVKRFEWKSQQDTDFQQACDELGVQCVYGDDIPQLIDQGVSAIVQDADYISVDGIAGDMDNAWQNGIPVFVLNAVPSGMNHAYTVSIDYNQWAAISLEWMAEKMGGRGEMILVYTGEKPPYVEAIEEFFTKYPDIIAVEQKTGKYNTGEELQPDVVNFVNTYPNLKAIWTTEQMDRVYWGLENAGIAVKTIRYWSPVRIPKDWICGSTKWKKIQLSKASRLLILPALPMMRFMQPITCLPATRSMMRLWEEKTAPHFLSQFL